MTGSTSSGSAEAPGPREAAAGSAARRFTRYALLTGVAAVLAVSLAGAWPRPPRQEDHPVVRGALGTRLDRYLTRAARNGFSGTVLVARGDTLYLHKGYGVADRRSGRPNATGTVYDVASITKQFTAAAILRLQDEGKLRLSDTLGRFFPEAPADKRAIRLDRILSHTAGLPPFSGDDREPITRDRFLARVWATPLRFRPGTRAEYSNAGYGILAVLIERLTGQPYERHVYEHVLRPAGMDLTGYARPRWSPATLARGYRGARDGGTVRALLALPDGPGWNLRGNGGMGSTTLDLFRWHLALSRGSVLSAASARRMCARASDALGGYGYGCQIQDVPPGHPSVGHGGDSYYFGARMRRYLRDRTVLIVLANYDTDGFRALVTELSGLLFAGSAAGGSGAPAGRTASQGDPR